MSETYDVKSLRENVEKQLQELIGLGKVDPNDVLRLEQDDRLAIRFLAHTHGDLTAATDLVYNCFQWRKQEGIALLTASCFPKEVLKKDGLYFHSEDIQGRRIFYMRIKEHVHVPEYQDLLKRYVLWLLDREYWRDTGAQIVVLFDMAGAGLKNIDMDLVKFILACFQTNFPNFLACLLVYELPLVLTAAWKIIQGWLSEAARKKIIFVKKRDIQNYIHPQNLHVHMGGMDNFTYTGQEFLDEAQHKLPRTDSQTSTDRDSLSNSVQFGSSDDVSRRSKVNRTISSRDFSTNSLMSKSTSHGDNDNFEGRYLTVSPGEQVLFRSKPCENEGSTAEADSSSCFTETVTLTNTYSKPVVFKIKTTSPNEYRIRPSADIVECSTNKEITIQFRPANKVSPNQTKKYSISGTLDFSRNYDKLQILALPFNPGTPVKEALESMKTANQEDIMQHKLICRHELPVSSKQLLDRPATVEDMSQYMQKMDEKFSKMEQKMNELIFYHKFVIAFVVISIFVLVYF